MAVVEGVDVARHSRTLLALGADCMRSLVQQRYLIVGLRGLGAEVAKNLALAGPRAIALCDPAPAALPDLGHNFFLRESDVALGLTRAAATLPRLQRLNAAVACSELPGAAVVGAVLPAIAAARFTAVVAAGVPRADAEALNAACRGAGIPFICSAVYGVYGFCFSDFGPAWEVRAPGGGGGGGAAAARSG